MISGGTASLHCARTSNGAYKHFPGSAISDTYYRRSVFCIFQNGSVVLRYINRHNQAENDTRGDFGSYIYRIVSKIDLDEFLKTDHARASLSKDPEHLFLKHPEGESPEEYQSVISDTKWNDPSQEVRADKRFELSVDASVNPIKGLLHN